MAVAFRAQHKLTNLSQVWVQLARLSMERPLNSIPSSLRLAHMSLQLVEHLPSAPKWHGTPRLVVSPASSLKLGSKKALSSPI